LPCALRAFFRVFDLPKPISKDLLCEDGMPMVDHICVSRELCGEVIGHFPKHSDGMRLSDHTGILARVIQ
jgi:hypothetical protein